jgi:hypothetical protein
MAIACGATHVSSFPEEREEYTVESMNCSLLAFDQYWSRVILFGPSKQCYAGADANMGRWACWI